jgi:dihydrofolate reductase
MRSTPQGVEDRVFVPNGPLGKQDRPRYFRANRITQSEPRETRGIESGIEKGNGMAKLVFGMNQSLDGYVDHTAFAPGPALFRHFIKEAEAQTGSVYGRKMYEIMRYWDDEQPEWNADERAFAAAWRRQPKWVVSRTLKSVGPNATLVEDDLERAIRKLKAEHTGEIEVAGTILAQSLTNLGLIDEYRIYLHPVVLGGGTPYFAAPRPPLHLITHDYIADDVIRLIYVPA